MTSIHMVRTPAGRARRAVVVAVLLIAAVVVGPQAFAAGDDDAPTVAAVTDTYTVMSGETLWSIASSLTVEGGDVRETMEEIQTLNAMSTVDLQAGTQIFIPALPRA